MVLVLEDSAWSTSTSTAIAEYEYERQPKVHNVKNRKLVGEVEGQRTHPIVSPASFGKGVDRFSCTHLFLGLIQSEVRATKSQQILVIADFRHASFF